MRNIQHTFYQMPYEEMIQQFSKYLSKYIILCMWTATERTPKKEVSVLIVKTEYFVLSLWQ